MQIILISLGAMIGAFSRYLMITKLNLGIYSIMIINIIGSFLLGITNTLNSNGVLLSNLSHKVITVGIIASFTTFSTFISDIVNLIIKKQYINAGIYFSLSIILSIIFMLIGIFLGNKISTIK